MRVLNFLIIFFCISIFFSCKNETSTTSVEKQSQPTTEKEIHFIDNLLTKYDVNQNTQQIILSYNQNLAETTGKLVGYQKIGGQWQLTFDTIDVNFGKKGFAAFDKKLEGDGKSPTGIFKIGKAFGYADDIPHDIDFITLNENHYWDSDSKSSTYNQLLTEKPATPLVEVMRRKDHLYKYGIIIEYNTEQAIPEKGSAIFLHVQRREGAHTAGCISMEEKNIVDLIKWLQPKQQPMVVMGNWTELIE